MGVTAKVVIYETFIEGRLEAPEHLTHSVHDLYFEPKYEEFRLMIRTQHTNPSMRNAVISTVTPYAIYWQPQHSHGGPRSSPTCRRRRRAWKIVINVKKASPYARQKSLGHSRLQAAKKVSGGDDRHSRPRCETD